MWASREITGICQTHWLSLFFSTQNAHGQTTCQVPAPISVISFKAILPTRFSQLCLVFVDLPTQKPTIFLIVGVGLVLAFLYARRGTSSGRLITDCAPMSLSTRKISDTRGNKKNRHTRSFFYAGGSYAEDGTVQDQIYVEKLEPEDVTQPYPVAFIHGGGMTGTNFLNTPDGRPGWADEFMNSGFVVRPSWLIASAVGYFTAGH